MAKRIKNTGGVWGQALSNAVQNYLVAYERARQRRLQEAERKANEQYLKSLGYTGPYSPDIFKAYSNYLASIAKNRTKTSTLKSLSPGSELGYYDPTTGKWVSVYKKPAKSKTLSPYELAVNAKALELWNSMSEPERQYYMLNPQAIKVLLQQAEGEVSKDILTKQLGQQNAQTQLNNQQQQIPSINNAQIPLQNTQGMITGTNEPANFVIPSTTVNYPIYNQPNTTNGGIKIKITKEGVQEITTPSKKQTKQNEEIFDWGDSNIPTIEDIMNFKEVVDKYKNQPQALQQYFDYVRQAGYDPEKILQFIEEQQ